MLATSLPNLGKMPGHHFHPRGNAEPAQPSEVKYIPMTALHEKSNGALDVVFDALRSQNLGKHPEMAIA
jgi:hypothetical protein